jgi:hypothetical protein
MTCPSLTTRPLSSYPRSCWCGSPVTTILLLLPIRVSSIIIWLDVVFCASSAQRTPPHSQTTRRPRSEKDKDYIIIIMSTLKSTTINPSGHDEIRGILLQRQLALP